MNSVSVIIIVQRSSGIVPLFFTCCGLEQRN